MAAVEADLQRDAGRLAGRDGGLGIGHGEGKGLFDEDVLAGPGGGDDFGGVLRMRRREDHRVDAGVGQHRAIVGGEAEAETVGKGLFGRRIAGDGGDKADFAAIALHRGDQPGAPLARAANGRSQHVISPLTPDGTREVPAALILQVRAARESARAIRRFTS